MQLNVEIGTNGPRIGMLGSGFMAQAHTHAARISGATCATLASSSPESSKQAARKFGYSRAASAEELLAEALPVVHICTPNDTHADYALAAIAAGSFVICEKPLASSLTDAEQVYQRALERGMVGAVPFVYRYHPMVQEARARFRDGEAGQVSTVLGVYLQDWLANPADDNWRVDPSRGGRSRAFADIGSHLVDLIEFVTGDRITRLAANIRTVYPERNGQAVHTEDTIALTIELGRGGIGSLLISQVAPGHKNSLIFDISGTNESVRFEQENPDQLWVGRENHNLLLHRGSPHLSHDSSRISFLPPGHAQGYQDAFNAFVADAYQAARGEVPESLPTFADGLRAAQLTQAVLDSASHGTWIDTPYEAR